MPPSFKEFEDFLQTNEKAKKTKEAMLDCYKEYGLLDFKKLN